MSCIGLKHMPCDSIAISVNHFIANLHESRTLDNLRDALLPKMLSGATENIA